MLNHLLAALAFGMAPAADVNASPASYLEIIPVFWRELYPDGGRTLYCDQRFAPYDRSVNVEHVFPMSWATKALRCGDRDQCRRRSERFNRIESDLHNLYPARKDINKARGAYPFGDIEGERPVVPGCDFEIDYRRRRAEPRPAVRGEIARSMLYMERHHGLPLHRRTKALMQRWHREDPPSDEERRRNDRIERLQGNRNPFIDSSERRK
jgi:deoxyribonuclease-1